MIRTSPIVSALTITLAASVAFAAGLKPFQKEALKKFNEEVQSSLDAANTACGIKLGLKADFAAFKAEDWSGQSISSRCTSVLDAIAAVCAKEAYKEELVKRIREVECSFGGKSGPSSEGTRANMSVTKNGFVFRMHADNVNLTEIAQSVIEAALNE